MSEVSVIGLDLAKHGCCQTDANQSLFGREHPISVRAEIAPLGESGGAVQLVGLAAGEAPI
jgi:hypothetical protein